MNPNFFIFASVGLALLINLTGETPFYPVEPELADGSIAVEAIPPEPLLGSMPDTPARAANRE